LRESATAARVLPAPSATASVASVQLALSGEVVVLLVVAVVLVLLLLVLLVLLVLLLLFMLLMLLLVVYLPKGLGLVFRSFNLIV
jgi:hypothetical protein